MDKLMNNFKISDYTSNVQLKKKVKSYLSDKNCNDIRLDAFPQHLIYVLVNILDEIVIDSLKYVEKHTINGLYVINNLILNTTLNENNKYNFCHKYIRNYNNVIKYDDNIMFNFTKLISNFEMVNGNKLHVEYEAKNLLCFLLVNIQYDILELAITILRYGTKKTMTKQLIITITKYLINNEISNKIKIKLDSLTVEIKDDELDEVEHNNDEIKKEVKEEINDEIKKEVKEEINEDIKINIREKIEEEIKDEIKKEIKEGSTPNTIFLRWITLS
jgi:hypothetical protein